jgi:hypothetical protein
MQRACQVLTHTSMPTHPSHAHASRAASVHAHTHTCMPTHLSHAHASRAACMPTHTRACAHTHHTREPCSVHAKCPYSMPSAHTHPPHAHTSRAECGTHLSDADTDMDTRAVQRACPYTHVHAYKPITHASRAAMPTHMCVPPHARAKTNPDTRAVQRACPYTRACLHTHHTHPSHAPTVCGVSLTSLTRTWLLLVEAREAVGSWVVLGRRWSLGDISNLKTQIVL